MSSSDRDPATPPIDNTKLPAHAPHPRVEPEVDVRAQREPFPPRPRLTPPEGAPNVLLILLDDMGFGASSAFGGPCSMPVTEELAAAGLRYTRFHTTAICAPTRAALLSGRNHHSVGMGNLPEIASTAPGYDGMRPPSAGTLAQTLNLNGYATGAFGKWHQTPPWEKSEAGPFDRWPTGEGFERFYGILDAECDQFAPSLMEGKTGIDPPATEEEGYHFSEDIVNRTTDWIRRVRTFDAGKPWFAYLSFGATHAPFHLPREWRGRNRGEFGHGWDRQRELTLARQKRLGVVPEDADLAPWTPGVPHWDELDDTRRLVAERLMELYASYAEHTDAQIGRTIEFLRQREELDDTLVVYILGDNGASAEGQVDGTFSEMATINGFVEDPERMAARLDELGGPHTYPHYPAGWAVAMNTPYQWTKQVASHYGGTRNGMIVSWPRGIAARGELRHQWHHVIDVLPTVLEAAGLPQPKAINGVAQDPIEGTAFNYSFDHAEAAERHTTQYFELFGNRGIYHEGWTAVAAHRSPMALSSLEQLSLADDSWELYDTSVDWSQAHDLAAERPEKLAELQELFLAEARKYNVLPIDDRGIERFDPTAAGRPQPSSTRSVVLTAADGRLSEFVVPDLKNASFRITVELEASADDSDGVLVAQGGRFGGWALYLKRGIPIYVLNLMGMGLIAVAGEAPIPAGSHTLELRFDYDGGGFGKGGEGRLTLDGYELARGRFERTVPFIYSVNEKLDVGIDRGTPVTEDYSRGGGNPYLGGRIETVKITVDDDAVEPGRDARLAAALGSH